VIPVTKPQPCTAALFLLVVCACGHDAREATPPGQDDQQRADPAPVVVGTNQEFSGNSFARNVSRQFGEEELRRLHAQLNAAPFKSQLEGYSCALPSFTVSVGLWVEGPFQERAVRMQMTPPLYRNSPCTEEGAQYLFQQAVKALDHGPPIDYHYRHALDGSSAGARAPYEADEPECRCGAGALLSAVAAKPPGDDRRVAHVHYLRGDHSVTVWIDTAGIAHQKDDATSSERPLTDAEATAFRQLAPSLCSVSGRYGPEYSRGGNLNWVQVTVELEGGPCHADVYDLDPTRMGHDELEKAQRVLQLAVALRKLFPDSYSREEQRVDDGFLAIPQSGIGFTD
jgi:hypothetical protein